MTTNADAIRFLQTLPPDAPFKVVLFNDDLGTMSEHEPDVWTSEDLAAAAEDGEEDDVLNPDDFPKGALVIFQKY